MCGTLNSVIRVFRLCAPDVRECAFNQNQVWPTDEASKKAKDRYSSEGLREAGTEEEDAAERKCCEVENRSTNTLCNMRSPDWCEEDAEEIKGESRDWADWEIIWVLLFIKTKLRYNEVDVSGVGSEAEGTVSTLLAQTFGVN